MNIDEYETEIENLKEKCETLQRQMDVLQEQKEQESSGFDAKVDAIKYEIDRDWKRKINDVEKKCRDEIALMSAELEKMRNAFSGDASGWVVKKTKQGREFYENVDTGETQEEMPEVLYIADAMAKAEKADEQFQELTQLKEKIKDSEMKKREAETALNKSRTEVNNLRAIEKGWKEASKNVSNFLTKAVVAFDSQADSIIDGMGELVKKSVKLSYTKPSIQKVTFVVKKLQDKVAAQEIQIKQLTAQYRKALSDIEEKDERIKRLSKGIDEEVERLVKPLREKTADCMIQVMKEKAARAQERRELADLWPDVSQMPTVLMQYRCLSLEERQKRLKRSRDNQASMALSIEIRENVKESRMWTVQYDEYGRQFFQHSLTGDTEWTQPAIMSYKPPPGRDEMGNVTITEEDLAKGWEMKADYKGLVYYQSSATGEITYEPPIVFKKIPVGREPQLFVGEAAHIVLSYIKSKIDRNTIILQRQDQLQRMMADGFTPAQIEEAMGPEPQFQIEAGLENEDLSKYQYDIETVEMLADIFGQLSLVKAKSNKESDEPEIYIDKRRTFSGFQNIEKIRSLLENEGTRLIDIDVTEYSIDSIQRIIQAHALREELLEKKLKLTREHLKDFSFVMMQRIDDARRVEEDKLRAIQLLKDKEEKSRQYMLKKQNTIRRKEFQRLESAKVVARLDSALPEESEESDEQDGGSLISGLFSVGGDENAKLGSVTEEVEDASAVDSKKDDTSVKEDRSLDLVDGKIGEGEGQEGMDHDGGEGHGDGGLVSGAATMAEERVSIHSLTRAQAVQQKLDNAQQKNSLVAMVMSDVDISTLCPPGLEGNYTDDILSTVYKITNFALFSGYVNLRMDALPNDKTVDYDDDAEESKDDMFRQDDEWLSHSFFLNITKDRVDGIRNATTKPCDSMTSVFGTHPLGSLRLACEVVGSRDPLEHDEDDPLLPRIAFVNDHLRREHTLWKTKQLMSEVLRFQIQQEAVKDSFVKKADIRHTALKKYREDITVALEPGAKIQQFDSLVELRVLSVSGHELYLDEAGEHNVFCRLTIGAWSSRTKSIKKRGFDVLWEGGSLSNTSIVVPKSRLENDTLRIEVFDENELRADTLVGSAVTSMTSLLHTNAGNASEVECKIYDRYQKYNGLVILKVIADFGNHEEKKEEQYDLETRNRVTFLKEYPKSRTSVKNFDVRLMNNDELSSIYPSLPLSQMNFSNLVADLRGDGISHVKALVGDVHVNNVLQLGHRINAKTVQKLPNFKVAINFLKQKEEMHIKDCNSFVDEIAELYIYIESAISKKIIEIKEQKDQVIIRHAKMEQSSIGIVEDSVKVKAKLDEVRDPTATPVEPVFEPFPPLDYVPKMPTQPGLDSKGKKKKDLKGADVKAIVSKIEMGDHDNAPWDFGERWPNVNQVAILKKAMDARNNFLDEKRAAEQAVRDQLMQVYTESMQKWEIEDRLRRNEYHRIKKESRRINLKLECTTDRINILASEITSFDRDTTIWTEFYDKHMLSKDRSKVLRAKQYLENIRQKESTAAIKHRLLALIDARRKAYDLPLTCVNEVDFLAACEKSEIALRSLRFEIVDCKHALYTEGVRLRNMFDEELGNVKSELNRVRMLKEITNQRISMDLVIARHKYEAFNLFEGLEKLKLVEADKDDLGLADTVDEKGEVYVKGKVWTSPAIVQQHNVLDVMLAKINLTEGIRNNAQGTQQAVLDVMTVKWGIEFAAVRDSWIENSDYERAQSLCQDAIQWVGLQRNRLAEKECELELSKERIKQELVAYESHLDVTRHGHFSETTLIAESTKEMVDVLRDEMVAKEIRYKKQIEKLEKTITELSKEYHKVREEKYMQALQFNSKIESLMSLVGILQSTLEHQSASMDILKEETSTMVINTRLESDRLRFQLRQERKHCANLLFIIHCQRSIITRLADAIEKSKQLLIEKEKQWKAEKRMLRLKVWENVFTLSHLCSNVDDLFEFFATRLANLAGARKSINDALRVNSAALVCSALCLSTRPVIRKNAARALGGFGWDGFTETRVLMWDSMKQWNAYKDVVLARDNSYFDEVKESYLETGTSAEIANLDPMPDTFNPPTNVSIRTMIKQRRQWALRAARRKEGPNVLNLKDINVKDGVIPTLVKICDEDGKIDWEIVRNAALAISVASFEASHLNDMIQYEKCRQLIVDLCVADDPEIRIHGAITLSNLCHENQEAQILFGRMNAIPNLLRMCRSDIPDVLEAATAALTNLTCLCDENCEIFMTCEGVVDIVKLLVGVYSDNFLDSDQNDEVQANASEILANISRFNCEMTVKHFDGKVIDVLILACASINKMVRRHGPLALGNISQSEWCRSEIGKRGGIEALFLALEDEETAIQANCLWALCNLMWHPPNQERAGRFIAELIAFIKSSWLPVRTNASILLANILYYNNPNRVRFLEIDGSMEMLIDIVKKNKDWVVTEASLRSLLSLSYIDAASLWLGTNENCLLLFLELLVAKSVVNQNFCSRYALEIINNMCIHHIVRRQLLDVNGIDRIVNLLAHEDIQVQETAGQVLEMLEDVTPPEVMAWAKKEIGLARMITLSTSKDPLVRAVAAESIGEEVWRNPQKQKIVNELSGVESLLSLCQNPLESVTSVLPALWSLRNVLHKNYDGQNQFQDNDGCSAVILVLKRCLRGEFTDQSDKILEACLSCLISAIQNHEHNARRLLRVGLDILMDVAEEKIQASMGVDRLVKHGLESISVISLSKSLLSMLSPYNYVVCKNCQKRQNMSGTHCISCGYLFFIDMSFEKHIPSGSKALIYDVGPNTTTASAILKKSRANNILASSPIKHSSHSVKRK